MASRPPLLNSPLVEVVYEVKFPGSFAVIAGLDRVQQAIGDNFPKLHVPTIDQLEAPALKHYRLVTADGLDMVGVAINSFMFSTKRYSVFADFKRRVEWLLDILREIHRPKSFSRLGLRFTNLLPWQAGTTSNVHPWLTLGASVPACLERPLADFQGNYLFECGDGARLRIMTGKAQQTRELIAGGRHQMVIENFLLDLDCSREGEIPPDQDVAFLPRAHSIIDEAFFALLTHEARTQLEGRQ